MAAGLSTPTFVIARLRRQMLFLRVRTFPEPVSALMDRQPFDLIGQLLSDLAGAGVVA